MRTREGFMSARRFTIRIGPERAKGERAGCFYTEAIESTASAVA